PLRVTAPASLNVSRTHPRREKKKAPPPEKILNEAIATFPADALAKDAPHPNTAWLFYRWAASEEGQKAYAQGGRLPPHPKVEPVDKIRPEKLYPIGTDEIKEWPKYEKVWKEIFQLR